VETKKFLRAESAILSEKGFRGEHKIFAFVHSEVCTVVSHSLYEIAVNLV